MKNDHLDSCVSDDALRVFLGQVTSYLTGRYEGDYQTYRECLRTPNRCLQNLWSAIWGVIQNRLRKIQSISRFLSL
jgi:hypothetical protein